MRQREGRRHRLELHLDLEPRRDDRRLVADDLRLVVVEREQLDLRFEQHGERQLSPVPAGDRSPRRVLSAVNVVAWVGRYQTPSIQIPSGPFVLSFLACSTNGPSIGFEIFDQFITNPAYGLTVDYDRTFHRNGK